MVMVNYDYNERRKALSVREKARMNVGAADSRKISAIMRVERYYVTGKKSHSKGY